MFINLFNKQARMKKTPAFTTVSIYSVFNFIIKEATGRVTIRMEICTRVKGKM